MLAGTDAALKGYQDVRDAVSMPFFEITDKIASFAWSLDEIKEHHVNLNLAMKAELEHTVGLSKDKPLAA